MKVQLQRLWKTKRQRGKVAPASSGRGVAGLILLVALLGAVAHADEMTTSSPSTVKAAYIRNFAHYVSWPSSAFADLRSPWCICILGDDPFGAVLEKTLSGRTEQGRPFAIFRTDSLDKLPSCQILFVAIQNAAKRRAALNELKSRPVLTVGDAPDFLREGGIIRFQVEDRVEMSINLDQARAASLTIQTKMLEVSREVLENGAVRKLR